MSQDVPSLDSLRDIVEGPPVSWWPPAPGWWIVGAIVLVAAGVAGWRAWQRWRANAYRRAALRELETATGVSTVAAILKRTALSAWPRSDVASLSGTAWCQWLRQTADTPLSDEVADMLASGVYRSDLTAVDPLREFASHWIRTHRVQDGASRPPHKETHSWLQAQEAG